MDNKYGLGSTRVAHAHHDAVKATLHAAPTCRFCGSGQLTPCPTLNDHFCKDCGEYQGDVPAGYSTGRNADY
jgi:hypothetical protein